MTTSRSHSRRDDHGSDKKSRSMSRIHHSPRKSTRIIHASSSPGIIPSVSLVWRHGINPEANILQAELRKMKPTFNGEHMKGEEAKAWLLGMKKYF
jgi:hypothetical protein